MRVKFIKDVTYITGKPIKAGTTMIVKDDFAEKCIEKGEAEVPKSKSVNPKKEEFKAKVKQLKSKK